MRNTEQSPKKGCLGKSAALAGVLVSTIYLLNPGAGVLELIPDNLPVVGNLDEVFFSGMLLASLAALGIRLPGFAAKRISHIHEKTINKTNN